MKRIQVILAVTLSWLYLEPQGLPIAQRARRAVV